MTSVWKRASRLASLAGQLTQQEIKRRLFEKSSDFAVSPAQLAQAAALVKELGQLKGAAMKLGQMLALEARDYLPDEVVQILEGLQNKASFMDAATVEAILQAELGDKRSLLRELSVEPFAAASIGQVHQAKLNFEAVAVKVQYPGVRNSIHADMKILGTLLKSLGAILRRNVELDGLINEFSEIFVQETSYRTELEALAQYRKLAAPLPNIVVPKSYPELSTERVLIMDFEGGLTLGDFVRQEKPDRALREFYGQLILDLYSYEFCVWGLVQTDPNLGNFLYRPDRRELVLLDFGATKSYSREFRIQYARLILAMLERNPSLELELAYQLDLIDPREPEAAKSALLALLEQSMQPFSQEQFDFADDEHLDKMRALSRTLVAELRYSPPPRNLIFLHRKLGGIFQMLRRLEVALDLRPFLQKFVSLSKQDLDKSN